MALSRLVPILVWLGSVLVLPAPFAARGMLVVPLVLVPLSLANGLGPFRNIRGQTRRRLVVLSFAAATLLLPAYVNQTGTIAAAFAVPWFAFCGSLAAVAVTAGIRSLPRVLLPSKADALLADAAFVLLAVGATFVLLERGGVDVLGVGPSIVLITAVHFHVLGFALVAVAALLAAREHRLARAATYPLLAGIALTASGFTFASTTLQWIGALTVVLGGLLTVGALAAEARVLAGWRRVGAISAAGLLVVGIPMGLAWATALQLGASFADFGTMVATHGALNTIGTTVAALAVFETTK